MRLFAQSMIALGLIVAIAGPLNMLGLNDITGLVMGDEADTWLGQLFSLAFAATLTAVLFYASHKILMTVSRQKTP